MEIKAPLSRERSTEEMEIFEANKAEILNLEPFSILYDIFPSKLWNKAYLKTCLYDDMDLLDALKAVTIDDSSKRYCQN